MTVNIHISGDTAGETLLELRTFAAGLSGSTAPTAEPKVDKPSRSSSAKKTEPVKNESATPAETDPASDPVETDETHDMGADIPSVVELRAKAQEVGTTPEVKKMIKALLDDFGSKSISDVPEDKRHAFMSGLAGLANED